MSSTDFSQAACAKPGVNPELFFPQSPRDYGVALGFCDRCPVRQPCGDDPGDYGVWGGIWYDRGKPSTRRLPGRPRKEKPDDRVA